MIPPLAWKHRGRSGDTATWRSPADRRPAAGPSSRYGSGWRNHGHDVAIVSTMLPNRCRRSQAVFGGVMRTVHVSHHAPESVPMDQRTVAQPHGPGALVVVEDVRALGPESEQITGALQQVLGVGDSRAQDILGKQQVADVSRHAGPPTLSTATSLGNRRRRIGPLAPPRASILTPLGTRRRLSGHPAAVAQMVEQRTENPRVSSSILLGGIWFRGLPSGRGR